MALKINFKDFKAQYPFRFTAKTTKEEANKLLSGIEANMDILPNFEVEEGTEVNSAFFRQLEKDINADQIRQDEAFQIAVDNIEVPVKSVNDKTGAVTLTASDVGAAPTNHGHAYGDITGKPSTFPPEAHTHTPSQVGLGSVLNYGIATTAEAQAGAVNNKYVTPALVKAAIQHLATTGGISMVKSVQRGRIEETGFAGSVPISSVNVGKSIVVLSGNRSGGSSAAYTYCRLESPNSLYAASYNTAQSYIDWQVIEYY